jgi:hypothetical protein
MTDDEVRITIGVSHTVLERLRELLTEAAEVP